MALADGTRVREMSGNLSTATLSANTLAQSLLVGDSLVYTWTGKSDWSTSDDEYELLQGAADMFAASYCLRRIADQKAQADALYKAALEICDGVRMHSGTILHVATQSYRTHPLNEDATPYRSLSGGNNSTDDSDLS